MEYRLKESDAMRAEIAQLRAELCECRVQSVRANVLEMQLQDLKWELARKTELQYRPDGASNAVTTLEVYSVCDFVFFFVDVFCRGILLCDRHVLLSTL
jgi:hypothetical protein